MSPTEIQTAAAIATLLKQAGSWPLLGFLVIVVGPWIFSLLTSRMMEKRFDAMKAMYENNVKLVECYESLASAQNEVVTLNTAKWAEAIEKIDTNQFCPQHRTRKQRMEDVG